MCIVEYVLQRDSHYAQYRELKWTMVFQLHC